MIRKNILFGLSVLLTALAVTFITSVHTPTLEAQQAGINPGFSGPTIWYDNTGTNAFGVSVTNANTMVEINGTWSFGVTTNAINLTNGTVHTITFKNGICTAVQ